MKLLRFPVLGIELYKAMRLLFVLLMAVGPCGAGFSFAEEPSKILAKVNNVPIILDEVEEEITIIGSQTLYHKDVSPERREAFKKEAVEKLIDKELEYQEAERQGMTAGREEIKERLSEIKKRFPSEKEFKETLRKNRLTEAKYEKRIEKALMTEKIFREEVEKKVNVRDDEVKAYYEKNRDRFKDPEMIRLRHIAIKFDPLKGNEDKERAREKAVEILQSARSGEDFAALAHEHSEDSYKEKDGDLGYVQRGRMDGEIEKAIFGLPIGEIAGPVETKYGFYLIKVEDKKPESLYSFDDMKRRIKQELEVLKKKERAAEWIAALRKKAKVEYVDQGTGKN